MSTTDEDIAKSIIATNGNNHHCKVVQYFHDNGWKNLISPYYIDPSTDKPREVDLITERLYYIKNAFGHSNRFIRIRLHVECKFVPNPIVYWFADLNRSEATEIAQGYSTLDSGNALLQEHHYLQEHTEAARLFATEHGRETENEWMFRAVNQVLNSVINLNPGPIAEDSKGKEMNTFTYPVIVLNSLDKLFKTRVDGKGQLERIASNFLFDVNYAYLNSTNKRQIEERYFIDVVSYDRLDHLLARLDREIRGLAQAHAVDVEY